MIQTQTQTLLPRESIAWVLYRQDGEYRPLRVRVVALDDHAQWLMPDEIPPWLRIHYGNWQSFTTDERSWPILQSTDMDGWQILRLFESEQAAWDALLKSHQEGVDQAQRMLADRREELNKVADRIQQIRGGG